MRKINKIINIALIFTTIGVFCYSNFTYSLPYTKLRPPHGFSISSKSETAEKVNSMTLQMIVKDIEEIRKRKITVEEKEFSITECREAMDLIFDRRTEISDYIWRPFDSSFWYPNRFGDLETFSKAVKEWLLFGNLTSFSYDYEKELYNDPAISKLRKQVMGPALNEWKLLWELLRALLHELGLTKNTVIIDLVQGANPGTCIIGDMVIGINDMDRSGVRDAFIDLYGSQVGLTREGVGGKLYYKHAVDITKVERIREAIKEAESENESFQAMPRVWLINQIHRIAHLRDQEIKNMGNLIKEGDLFIISGSYSPDIKRILLETEEYEEITKSIPANVLNIFEDGITDRFSIYGPEGTFQHIYRLASLNILRKKPAQEPALTSSLVGEEGLSGVISNAVVNRDRV
ncbi:MAG: hypothetical protein HQ532_01395 [Candidatus Omnitrophica bacterium]|nr:hypothetical protein [Candidatus Omnitrophota bacterium]